MYPTVLPATSPSQNNDGSERNMLEQFCRRLEMMTDFGTSTEPNPTINPTLVTIAEVAPKLTSEGRSGFFCVATPAYPACFGYPTVWAKVTNWLGSRCMASAKAF